MRTLCSWIATAALVLPAIAQAAPLTRGPAVDLPPQTLGWIGETGSRGPRTLMQVIPPIEAAPAALGTTQIVYLNRRGATLAPGNNDARTNRSTVVQQTSQIPAFEGTDAEWAQIMSCTRTMFAPFDIQITDVDPGNAPHVESIMGGRAEQAGMQQGVLGVSPFTADCQVIPNAIVYTFTQSTRDAYGTSGGLAEEICEIAAQEIAHAFGLDHEYLASDPMTYLNYNGLKQFQNVDAQCGEYAARPCGLPGTGVTCAQRQNSVALLTQRIGLADAVAPTVAITSPADAAVVPPTFTLSATASDNRSINRVELYVDGQLADTLTAAPFSFAVANLTAGTHTLDVKATDGKNMTQTTIHVTARSGATAPTTPTTPTGPTTPTTDDGAADTIVGGCATGGGPSGSAAVLLALGAAVALRRRTRR